MDIGTEEPSRLEPQTDEVRSRAAISNKRLNNRHEIIRVLQVASDVRAEVRGRKPQLGPFSTLIGSPVEMNSPPAGTSAASDVSGVGCVRRTI